MSFFVNCPQICCDLCPASFHLQCHDPPLSDSEIPEGDWSCIQCFSQTPDCKRLVAEARRKLAKEGTKVKEGQLKDTKQSKVAKTTAKGKEKQAQKSPEKVVDGEWCPGTKKKLDVAGAGRSRRAVSKKTQYADHSTEDEDEEVEVKKPTGNTLGPVFSHSGKNYKQLYVEHLSLKPVPVDGNPFSFLLAAASQENAQEFELPLQMGAASQKFPYSWKWSTEGVRKRGRDQEEEMEPGQPNKVRLCYVCVRSSRLGPLVSCDFCSCAFHMDCLDPPLSAFPTDVWMCPNHVENFLDARFLSSTSATERVRLWEEHARQPIDSHAVKLQFLRRCHRAKRNKHFSRRLPIKAGRRAVVPGYVKAAYKDPVEKVPGPMREVSQLERKDTDGWGEEEGEWLAGVVALQTQIAKEKVARLGGKEHTVKEDVKDFEENVKIEEGGEKEIMMNGDTEHKDEEDDEAGSSTISARSNSPPSQTPSHNLTALLSEYLSQHTISSVADLDPAVVQYLAHRHLQTLLPSLPSANSVRARASLTPVGSRVAPVLMQYRSLAVGAGEPQGLDLRAHGTCRYVSRKHATIFFDELSGEYELLNYSAHGTRVDSVMYCLDLAGMDARFPVNVASTPVPQLTRREERTKPKSAANIEPPCMAGKELMGGSACSCSPGPPSGCEGSALLRHGSLVQFGCLQFVFSLSEEAAGNCAEL